MLPLLGLCLALPFCAGSLEEAQSWGDTSEQVSGRRRGYAPLLYLQSHCDVPADRDRYVRELMRYIPVGEGGAGRGGWRAGLRPRPLVARPTCHTFFFFFFFFFF